MAATVLELMLPLLDHTAGKALMLTCWALRNRAVREGIVRAPHPFPPEHMARAICERLTEEVPAEVADILENIKNGIGEDIKGDYVRRCVVRLPVVKSGHNETPRRSGELQCCVSAHPYEALFMDPYTDDAMMEQIRDFIWLKDAEYIHTEEYAEEVRCRLGLQYFDEEWFLRFMEELEDGFDPLGWLTLDERLMRSDEEFAKDLIMVFAIGNGYKIVLNFYISFTRRYGDPYEIAVYCDIYDDYVSSPHNTQLPSSASSDGSASSDDGSSSDDGADLPSSDDTPPTP